MTANNTPDTIQVFKSTPVVLILCIPVPTYSTFCATLPSFWCLQPPSFQSKKWGCFGLLITFLLLPCLETTQDPTGQEKCSGMAQPVLTFEISHLLCTVWFLTHQKMIHMGKIFQKTSHFICAMPAACKRVSASCLSYCPVPLQTSRIWLPFPHGK